MDLSRKKTYSFIGLIIIGMLSGCQQTLPSDDSIKLSETTQVLSKTQTESTSEMSKNVINSINEFLQKNPEVSEMDDFIVKHRLGQIQSTQELREIQKALDPNLESYLSTWDFFNKIEVIMINRQFQLLVNEKPYPAETIYSCKNLKNNFDCIGTYADDTAHITEFNFHTIYLSNQDSVQLSIHDPYSLKNLVEGPYIIDPEEMHETRYQRIQKIPMDKNGTLDLSKVPTHKNILLFAIFKDHEGIYRKLIWVIQSPPKKI